MSNNFLSQEEINALLSGEALADETNNTEDSIVQEDTITDLDKDLLGEIGNISMGSASTALYQLINQQVNITTPVVSVTTLKEIKQSFHTPNIIVDIEYVTGIVGRNIFIIETPDGLVISNLMMGGDGIITDPKAKLSELEVSAVAEAMNQMIGSAATSMATMFGRKVDISPPNAKVVNDDSEAISEDIDDNENIVKVSFKMTIGDLVDSSIMQVFPIKTAKNIVAIMTGEETSDEAEANSGTEKVIEEKTIEEISNIQPQMQNNQSDMQQPQQMQYGMNQMQPQMQYNAQPMQQPMYNGQPQQMQYGMNQMQQPQMQYNMPQMQQPMYGGQQMQYAQPVEVHNAAFEPLVPQGGVPPIKNMDLIMDVPLDISVVLGRSRKSIQEILDLGPGSLIELDKLAEEPVEILVNGKAIALGEVVVIDENFGVRITSIVSDSEKIKSLKH